MQALHLDEIAGLRAFFFVFLCDEKSKDENLMNLDKDYLRGVDTTISTLSWLAEQLHQVLMTAFHFWLLLFNFLDIQILQLFIPMYAKL